MQQGPPTVPQPEQRPEVQVPELVWPVAQVAPAATHEPPKQQAPPPQVAPAQHTLPGSPQRAQTWEAGLHAVPGAVQALPAQQLSPAFPQGTHALPLQRVPLAVHAPPAQQG